MATKKKPKKKAKQGYLDPEMAPISIKEIDNAADEYVDARNARQQALAEEIERKGELKEVLKKHGITEYEYDDKIVTFIGEPDVRVRKKKKPKEEVDV